MKVKLTRPTYIDGAYVEPPKTAKDAKSPFAKDGSLTVSEAEGARLISAGKAIPIADTSEAAEENRDNDGSNGSTR